MIDHDPCKCCDWKVSLLVLLVVVFVLEQQKFSFIVLKSYATFALLFLLSLFVTFFARYRLQRLIDAAAAQGSGRNRKS